MGSCHVEKVKKVVARHGFTVVECAWCRSAHWGASGIAASRSSGCQGKRPKDELPVIICSMLRWQCGTTRVCMDIFRCSCMVLMAVRTPGADNNRRLSFLVGLLPYVESDARWFTYLQIRSRQSKSGSGAPGLAFGVSHGSTEQPCRRQRKLRTIPRHYAGGLVMVPSHSWRGIPHMENGSADLTVVPVIQDRDGYYYGSSAVERTTVGQITLPV